MDSTHHLTDSTTLPPAVERKVSLQQYNTFQFDYQAEFFAIVDNLETLKSLLGWARQQHLSVTMLGGGSNLLISADIPGLVIINRLKGCSAKEEKGNHLSLVVGAGENWHKIVEFTVQNNWFGIENLALIPGTAGAAPVQNIGAYGVEVKDSLARVQVLDRVSLDVYWINAHDCGFAYRDSHFKGQWKEKYFITAIELSLKKRADLMLSYGGLANQIDGEPSLQKVFQAVCQVRSSKLPDPNELANAGSFFKNPIVSVAQHSQLKESFPSLVSFPHGKEFKLAAGWLIDQAGWKGKVQQGVGVYEKQALVLINHQASKAESLLELEASIKASVFDLYGVELEREPVQLPGLSGKLNQEIPL
ncbi:UDP-N-acetylmuramate dehydrogenase [Marinomonas posidonica]|uniref:UDP-N-acetylenolpyruvoylglucosamine reductase n=1 Tax=Marinomonas posidonica (strain CECT 7376 / NCIMB 14433 / IVIA-Po-181) TaxID=491952 RepID=F6D164_MARPP|nr:UDP-N-acetylmuramate dehydrogenase [Marinomonas posidonica]AEF54871.1 UDP-N-acetylenolpyruvoylglucosamine reductase [Marinomonas posidonica IVIA-Po-181]